MRGLFKWIGILLIVLLIPAIIGLGALLFAPNPSISWLLRNTADLEYVAESTDISLWPVAVELRQATITPVGGETLATLDSGSLQFHLWRYLTNAPRVWSLAGENIEVQVPTSPDTSDSSATADADADAAAAPLDLALPLAFSRVAVKSLTIKPADGEAISVSIDLEREQQADDAGTAPSDMAGLTKVATKITLHQPNRDDFEVTGTLGYRLGATNKLELLIDELNLNPLLATTGTPATESSDAIQPSSTDTGATDSTTAPAPTSTPIPTLEQTPPEAPMDWAWVQTLGQLDLSLRINQLIAGVHQLQNFTGQLVSDQSSLKLNQLSGQYRMLDSEQQSQVEQSFTGQIALTPLGLQTQGADAKVDLTLSAEHFAFGVEGQANLNAMAQNQLNLELDVNDFKIVGNLLNKDFAPLTPLTLAAEMATDVNIFSLNNLKAKAGASDLSGSIKLVLADAANLGLGGVAEVYVDLQSDLLRIAPLADLQEPVDDNDANDEAKDADSPIEESTKLFSDDPLPLVELNTFIADVSLTATKLGILEAEFTDFVLTATSADDVLKVEPAAKFGGGGFGGSFSLTPKTDLAELDIQFNMSDIDLEAFELVSKDQLTGGITNFDLNISSQGASSAEIAAKTEGLLLLTVTDAVVQNDTFELAGSDLIMEALSKLNPFAKTDPTTKLSCALVKFDGTNGVWETKNQLVVETEKMEIIGNGKIDLTDETLDIGITPSAKGGVGVNVGSLVKFLKVGGPLTSPRPQADAAGLLKSGAAIGAAASTGGLSILADSLAKRVVNAGDACTKARTEEKPASAGAPAS